MEGKPKAMVLAITVSAVDRGACIRNFSQYPAEVEYLWVPCSFLQQNGSHRLEVTDAGTVTIIPVRVNSNLKSATTEELLGQKKEAHLVGFRHLLNCELKPDLNRIAEENFATQREMVDLHRHVNGRQLGVRDLIEKICEEVKEVIHRHEKQHVEGYTRDELFAGLVTERVEAKRMAVSRLRLWLQDPTLTLVQALELRPRVAHRQRLLRLRAAIRSASSDQERRSLALDLCRVVGLVREEVDERNDLGETRLLVAAAEGESRATFDLLRDAGADLAARDAYGFLAARLAATNGHPEVLRVLRDLGAPTDPLSLVAAAENGHVDTVRTLVEELGADMEARSPVGFTGLLMAAHKGHPGTCELLLDLKADLEATSNRGLTPLLLAAQGGHVLALRVMAARGANLTRPGDRGPQALGLAARNGHVGAVEALVNLRADLEARDGLGRAPLALAVAEGRADAARALLSRRADPGAADHAGETPVHMAVVAQRWDLAQALLAAADAAGGGGAARLLAAQDSDGWTCLHLAAALGRAHDAAALAGGAHASAAAAAREEVENERAAEKAGAEIVLWRGEAKAAVVRARARVVAFLSYCSVLATVCCRAGEMAYLEVEVVALCEGPQVGLCGLGWRRGREENADGGAGDCSESWAVDGARRRRWHNQKDEAFGSEWRPGDVIGIACQLYPAAAYGGGDDKDEAVGGGGEAMGVSGRGGEMWVSVNGDFSAPNGRAFVLPRGLAGLRPVLSAVSSRFRVALQPDTWRFPPPCSAFRPFQPLPNFPPPAPETA